MFTDADSSEDTASLLADVTDDSHRIDDTEIVPLTRDTDGLCTTDCDSEDCSAQVIQESIQVVKQEHEDGDVINASCCNTNDAEHDEVDETQCRIKLADLPERLKLTGSLEKDYNVTIIRGSWSNDGSLTAHREQLYSCSQCGKCFSHQCNLYNHMNTHSDKYKCTECGKCWRSRRDLTEHKRSHSGEKPFECAVCGKRFALAGHLSRHSRIHSGEKPYKCHLCDKAFGRTCDLNRHLRVHTGDKPYTCSLCQQSFTQSSSLHAHKVQVHSTRRLYECFYCGKLFKTHMHLKQHVRIHTGAKPHSCEHCSESFTRSDELKTHLLKSHNEGTWLTCHICQKKFSHGGNLKTHIRRHEGVKPYVCSECPKCFSTAAELRQHQPVHLDYKQY